MRTIHQRNYFHVKIIVRLKKNCLFMDFWSLPASPLASVFLLTHNLLDDRIRYTFEPNEIILSVSAATIEVTGYGTMISGLSFATNQQPNIYVGVFKNSWGGDLYLDSSCCSSMTCTTGGSSIVCLQT